MRRRPSNHTPNGPFASVDDHIMSRQQSWVHNANSSEIHESALVDVGRNEPDLIDVGNHKDVKASRPA